MEIYLTVALYVLIFFNLVYLLAVLDKDFSIIDIAWGLGFILVLVLGQSNLAKSDNRSFILSLMILIWGLRLSIHLFFRNRKTGEDHRYQNMRARWGKKANLKAYFYVFLFQAVLLLIVSSPIILILKNSITPLVWSDLLGIFIFIVGIVFETIADWQIYKFKKNANNKGKLFTKGLYKYSQHPNYFGEFLIWWGVFFLSIADGPILLCLIGPITISVLLLKVSGVPLLKKRRRQNPKFQDWALKTSSFIPWPPKN